MAQYQYTRTAEFYPKQKDVIDAPERLTVTFGGTKSGKTSSHAIWITEQAFMASQGEYVLWCAPSHETAKIAFDLIKQMLRQGGMKEFTTNNQFHSLVLANGVTMRFVGSNNWNSIYGYSYVAVVVDEGSRCLPEAWTAVQSTTTFTGCPVKIVGNVTTRSTWMWKLWESVTDGTVPNASAHMLTYHDAVEAGILDQQIIDEIRATIPEAEFLALYECIPLEEISNPFGIESIRRCIIPREDLDSTQPVVYGIDPALTYDFFAILGMNLAKQVVSLANWQGDWSELKPRVVGLVGETPTLVDSSSMGGAAILSDLAQECRHIEGFNFTQRSKKELIEDLIVAVQKGEIGIPSSEVELIKQLESFEAITSESGAIRYSGKRTGKDDAVMALALAHRKLNELQRCSFLPVVIESEVRSWEEESQWVALEDWVGMEPWH